VQGLRHEISRAIALRSLFEGLELAAAEGRVRPRPNALERRLAWGFSPRNKTSE
jgi:hypothetical protein